MSRQGRLEGKVAIVTGAAHGMGKAYSLRFVAEGAKVAIADMDLKAAEDVAEEIKAKGGQALAVETNVADAESVERMVGDVAAYFGKIDILINNAAIFSVQALSRVPFWEISEKEWDRVMAVNVKGIFLCCRAVLPYMKAVGGGKIINTSSSAVFLGNINYLHYIASKAAVIGLTRSMAREVGDFNITVNAIAPGGTLTEESPSEEMLKRRKSMIAVRCIKRIQYVDDLVGTAVYLASSDSDFVSGQTIVVDGGYVMH